MSEDPFKWHADDTNASYGLRRQGLFLQHGAAFVAASGAPRGRWHVVADYIQFPRGHILSGRGSCSLVDAAGRSRSFATHAGAKTAADGFMARAK